VLLGCADDDARPTLRYEVVTPPERGVVVEGELDGEVRAMLLDAMDRERFPGALAAAPPWETVVVGAAPSAADPRAFVRRGSELQLDARLGAGDRGTYMGGEAFTGAERVMVQVAVADPERVSSRFEVRIWRATGEARPEDLTPRYLRSQALPRGTYRAWMDVPPEGARFLVEVRTVSRDGEQLGWAWSSPMGVVRPWLR